MDACHPTYIFFYNNLSHITCLQLACAVSIVYENENISGPEIFSKDKFCGIEVR